MHVEGNPWLRIPPEDYEGHMAAIGQSAVLRDLFSLVYAERRPSRLAVLGCTTGQDLQHVDPALTELIVGVDINPAYLEAAKGRLSSLGPRLHLICEDVLTAELPRVPFDLVHAALLLEYVDPRSLFQRIYAWLSPEGVCSVITQEPAPDVAAISATKYESLQTLAGRMSLRSAEETASLACQEWISPACTSVPSSYRPARLLVHSIFAKAGVTSQQGVST